MICLTFVFERRDAFAGEDAVPKIAENRRELPESARVRQNPPEPAENVEDALLGLGGKDRAVCEYLKAHPSSKAAAVSGSLGIKRRTLNDVMGRLREKGLVVAHGDGKNRTYSLRNEESFR